MDSIEKSESIICPQLTSWIEFALILLIAFFGMFIFGGDLIRLILILPILFLIIPLCVTFGISNKNHSFYISGIIISWLISVLSTIFFIWLLFLSFFLRDFLFLFVLFIILILIWIPSGILMGYNKKVKKICEDSPTLLSQTPMQDFGNEALS